MIADIFYPIFTLTITVLACFVQKLVWGFCLHQGITVDLLEGLQLPQTPSCNRFWFGQKPMRLYFFCIIPWLDEYKCYLLLVISEWFLYLDLNLETIPTFKKQPPEVFYINRCFKKYTLARVFPCELCKSFKSTVFTEHLRTTDSDPLN